MGFRDVKPGNFCIGPANDLRSIYLIDYGMVRRFRQANGSIRPQRECAGFRGTARFVSLRVHMRKEQVVH
jgi:tau tubulin kinase